jgi:3',5'-cyclic AMP phosphodiesterase CpdA
MKRVCSVFIAIVVIVSMLVLPASAADAFTGTAAPDHIVLSWTDSPATTQTFTWRTDTTTEASIVQYKVGANASLTAGTEVKGTGHVYKTDLGDEYIHTATITGLIPDTTYTYRVGDGTNWSAANAFTTAAADTKNFKFFVFGDSQPIFPLTTVQYDIWKQTLTNAYAKFPDVKFMVNLGDTSENGGSGAMWDKFFEASKAVLPKLPEMVVQGNHDCFTAMYGQMAPEGMRNQFTTPANGPVTPLGLQNSCYSYDYGNVHFVVLDSQILEEALEAAGGGADILAPQLSWLDKDLAAHSKAAFTVVMMHKPIYYNVNTRANDELKPFIPVFDKYHVDIVMAGHDHQCAITYPMKNDSPVSSAAQGTVYMVMGRSGEKYYTNAHRNVYDQFFYDTQDQPTYNVVSVSGQKLTVDMYKQDGSLITSYTIDKGGAGSTPTAVPGKSNYVRLSVCGNLLTVPQVSTAPSQVGGVWYIPLKTAVQAVNGSVTWNAADATITIAMAKTAVIKIGSTEAAVNGVPVTLKYAPISQKGSALIAAEDVKNLLFLASGTIVGQVNAFSYRYDEALNMILLDD